MSKDYMALAVEATIAGMKRGDGGPFGATIVRQGKVVVSVGNTMTRDTDPSAHAEMVAVRKACQILQTMDLSDCEVYATCEPCPMCVGVMMWAKIKRVYYGSTHEDAALNGFSDQTLRDHLSGHDETHFTMSPMPAREDCDALWTMFKAQQK